MPRKKKLYVVGFDGDFQCVYGKDEGGIAKYIDPLTLNQAERKLRELQSARVAKVIYKLVPVAPMRRRLDAVAGPLMEAAKG